VGDGAENLMAQNPARIKPTTTFEV